MAKCDHISWVKLAEGPTAQLVYGSRFARVVAELPDPSTQLPQVVFCLGRRSKDQALKELCGGNYRGQHRLQRCINLRSDNRTLHSLQPRFFADCDPTCQPRLASSENISICHPDQAHPIDLPSTAHSLYDLLLSRLLFLHVDVLCVFADDMGGLEGVRERLCTWARIGSASNLSNVVRPRVIVVSEQQSVTHDLLEDGDFLYELLHVGDVPFHAAFGDVQVFCRLPPGELSSESRYLGLRQEVTQQLRNMRLIREQRQVLFSATHLNAFFELSLQHFCAEPFVPFNHIKAARKWYPLDGAFTSHLISFLEAGKRVPYDEVASYIASTILMDAYPIRMHHFCPLEVFKTLYRDACNRALRHCYSTDAIVRIQCNKIEARLSDFFHEMATSSTPAWEIHRRNLSSQKRFWTHARSNMTCLLCLRRHPEHVLTCGHAICDTCTEVFGEPAPHAYDEYIVRECVICGALANLTVKMKPRTAGPRVLAIDGGGSLVVTSLENLEILQEILGPDLPVGEFFELKVGSSSGGLVVLSMTTRALDIAQCKTLFQTLAKKVFSFRRKWIGAWLHDEKYHGSALDDVLMEHYTPTQRLYGTPASLISSGKVAVTVTSLDGDSCILTNYNGTVPRQMEPVYERLRPEVGSEPFVWQAARATAAAPSLFSTVSLPGLGSFQDGGIPRYNNPASVAELEVKHLWPGANPDVFITLGTGTGPRSPKPSSFRNILIDGWIPRVYRAMQRTFDGRVPWLEQYSRLDDNAKEHYFRFDPCFHKMPSMDDTRCMEYLSEQTRIQSSWQNSSEAAVTLLVSSLFFQLDAMPEYQSGFFHCKGTIRSRCPPEPLIRRLSQLEPGRQDFFKDQINLGIYLSAADVCSSCHRYSLAARFYVRSLDETIALSLRLGATKRRLSAFPKSMQQFIEEQGLDSPFGHSNHDIPLLVNCTTCMTRTGAQRRKRKFIEL